MTEYKDIYEYVQKEEAAFSQPIDVDGWPWSFKEHVKKSFYYLHGRYMNGNDDDTPFKNIVRRICKLAKTLEDIELKDILLYVDNPEDYHLSFLIKKYHDDVFAVEHNLDEFIDKANESRYDYGGGLLKKGKDAVPEIIDLRSIAFCDQTNLLKGPLAFKHFFNPAELKDMEEVGWGSESNGATASIQDLIDLSKQSRQESKQSGVENKTPGNYVEIYEVHGVLPKNFLTDKEDDKDVFTRQFQIIGFYHDKQGMKQGVTLFRKSQSKPSLKLVLRDEIYSRALGFGGVEELFEDQAWTNFDEIHYKEFLKAASKIVMVTTDPNLARKQNLKNVENLQILEKTAGSEFAQADTFPRNIQLFKEASNRWEEHAQGVAFATDPLMGEAAPSGTPFRAQERQVIQGKGPHDRDKGKYAKFIEEVYRDWIIPHIASKITEGATFLSELSLEEMQFVSEALAESESRKYAINRLTNGEIVLPEEVEAYKENVKQDFAKKGNKHFIKILKGEFKKKPLKVKVNVAGKQKDLALMVDKLTNLVRELLSTYNPQTGSIAALDDPRIAKLVNQMLEYSGLSPVSYAGMPKPQLSPIQPNQIPV